VNSSLDGKMIPRLAKLMVGLFIYGLGIACMVDAKIGIAPWDVLAQGISVRSGVSYGIASIVVSVLVLLTWIPLKVKPGIGSVLNAICIGLFTDLWLPLVPKQTEFLPGILQFTIGMVIVAFATGLYISSNLGMGPRDGLIMGSVRKFGRPVWQIRTFYESIVLTVGWLLGGQVGLGTVMFAFGIGYLMQTSLRFFKAEGNR
jgi:uncharacterized membrane protein YczE